ncbi:MAG: Mo-dependent nitrogenase C-terminal domain-containing protein [Prochlorotrichaceae cyanobacterium]|jgi:tellurite resistance protein
MVSAVTSPTPRYTNDQISAWLQGLLTVAWADGHFDAEEKVLIQALMEEETLSPDISVEQFKPIAASSLQETFGDDTSLAQNFLRTAVMVAVADGVYSAPEDALLHEFAKALHLEDQILDSLRATLYHPDELESSGPMALEAHPLHPPGQDHHGIALLHPVQDWMDGLEVHDSRVARFICRLIPPQCPFERDITLFGRKIVHIPPLCQLNPLYEQLVGLRFRALSYLADDCGEDVTPYC